ncbi:hypothetical protein ACP70R_027405 [Stipagrostis hirtigluma subsp. patula]
MCSAKQALKSNMLILLALLLLSYGVGNVHCSTVPENSADMLSLLDFKKAVTNDPRQVFSNWNTSTPFCQWMGVNCSQTHTDRVVVLDLAGQSLTGTLAASLGNLTFLRTLNLSTNYFSGQLPDLSHLRKLEVLDLSSNSLQGVIPETLTYCSSLRELVLNHNSLQGEIPLKVGLLSKLTRLSLRSNNLTGVIPPTLNNTQLQIISLTSNHLTGSIPDDLGHLSNLSVLLVSDNMLSGGFPPVLLSMPSLTMLDLGMNMLHGTLPSNLGDALPNLTHFVLFSNNFEGQIPASLGNASGLELIDLSSNHFSGEIPPFGRLTELYKLNLEDNKLETPDSQSWEFLYALRNSTNLNFLLLAGNRLSGVIPNYIGELYPGLQFLLLDDNNLSGIVPSSIGNLTGLIDLTLSNNSLIGTVGEWIGMQKGLQNLELDQNNFNGPIPSSIGNLTQLGTLSLEQNNFTGTIPTSLGHLQQLQDLDLSWNNLHGNIPAEVFRVTTLVTLVLSYNKLEGPIPSEASHLTQLTELHLSSNKIIGSIPDSLSECQELTVIQLDQNFLNGSIPMSFGNLTTLSMLNLSHNNLSGSIPTSLSGLRDLNLLDLSYNCLQGKIPFNGVFANATAVSLSGNLGLCGGSLDLHMPRCSSGSRRLERQYYLIRVLIPIFGFLSLVLLIYFVIVEKKMPRAYSLLPYFGDKFPKVSYMDLAQATGNFSNLVGSGSYGSVYRGKLTPSKLEVAVKILNLDIHGAEKSFLSECEALRGIKHRNLLPIITACSTVDSSGSPFKALVYPFMPNGNLDTWLHHKEEGKAQKHISLTQRISIAVNIADALDYLHNDNGRAIIHCDIKPSNILLDDDMTARLGDFGIASFYIDSESTSTDEDPNMASSRCISSIGVKGTIGYIAPEYGGGGYASTYGDVYSFGIVLLEMVTGKRPTDPMFKNGLNIVNYVQRSCPDKILDIVDATIQEDRETFAETNIIVENTTSRCLMSLLQLALSCTRQFPRERINIREVASKIRSIKTSQVGGKSKDAA